MEVDLNLLRVFDILYEECNVTRAAARLFLTQSAVSHALARLRDVLGDPLFLRVPSGLQPTERAHQLAPRLRVALAEIRSVVAVPVFDPTKTSRRFTISASSYFSSLTARLIALARKSAPGISLQIVNTGAKLTQALDQQQVDIALGGFDRIPSRFRSEMLFRDQLAWVISARHPLAEQPLDHAGFLARPLLGLVATPVADRSRERLARDDILLHSILEVGGAVSSRPAKRASTPIMVDDAPTALAVIAATDMVALFPRRYAETSASSAQIRIVDLPRDHAEMIEISMLWHSRVHDDPGLLWLRALIREALNLSSDVAQPRGYVTRTGKSASAGRKARRVPVRTGRAKVGE
jgi:DNA-binding transcriptional LysR family regulator